MDKIDLEGVNIKIKAGDLSFPAKIGEWRPEAELTDATIELEFDVNQLEDEYLTGILEERGFYVADDEPDIADYTDDQIETEAQHRGFYVADDEPDEVRIGHFSDSELIEELEYRDHYKDYESVGWYYRAGQFEEFLIHLERIDPIAFAGLSKMRLVKE